MTEDRARKTMCFRAATFGGSQQTVNGPGPFCIASKCMAWRWRNSGWDLGREFPTVPQYELDKLPSGYCGLVERDQ